MTLCFRRSMPCLLLLAACLPTAFGQTSTQIVTGTGQQPKAVESASTSRVDAGLAATPPMGWNTWNKFACHIDEALIRQTADALVTSGMRDAGYQYLVIDDCWHGERDAHGDIQPDPKRFPAGMEALSAYVHSKGLKFGIYSDAGKLTCGGRPGSRGYEYQDAAQYARWGVDYLKEDWCNTGTENAEDAYSTMRAALNRTGRPILLSLCEWGTAKPWLWAAGIGNMWRTTGDIDDKWEGKFDYKLGIMNIVDLNESLYPYGAPGHWNDPDMLEVGNGGLSLEEYKTHFTLWAMMAAPLIAGNDVAHMTPETRSILLNREVIAIDQDPLGQPGRRIGKQGDTEVWLRQLAEGKRALVLFNRGASVADIPVRWSELGYPEQLSMKVRDIWKAQELGTMRKGYTAHAVPSHAVVALVITPAT